MNNQVLYAHFLNQARAWFLIITFISPKYVYMRVCASLNKKEGMTPSPVAVGYCVNGLAVITASSLRTGQHY